MLLPDPEFEKMLKKMDKHIHVAETIEEPEPVSPQTVRLRQVAATAGAKRQLWRQCAGKRCRRMRRCCAEPARPGTWDPACAALFDDWERGFYAGAAFALGSGD